MKLALHNAKGEVTDVTDPDQTYTAKKWASLMEYSDGSPGYTWIFESAREVRSSPEGYYLPRGEWSNAAIRWPFAKERTKAELDAKGEGYIAKHRAALSTYCRLRAQGNHPQVAYIVAFAAKSEENAELIDRAHEGANYLEARAGIQGEIRRMADALPILPVAKEMLVWIDDQLKKAHKPGDRSALWEWRGRLSSLIERELKKSV
ncbi:hypothetical protein [Caballeronia sp. M23-90]